MAGKGICIRDACTHQGSMYVTPQGCPNYDGPFMRTQ
jgi:hypothetical protein